MQLAVSGKNLDVTEPIRAYAERKLERIERHLPDGTRVDLEISVERHKTVQGKQRAELTVWTSGPVLRAHEASDDLYAAIDLAIDKLDRQVKKYRDRKRRWHPRHGVAKADSVLTELDAEDESAELAPPLANGDAHAPSIVRTKRFNMKPMDAEEAALQLEMVGHEFFVFLSADTEDVAVIYRRRDGDLGVIEPVRA